MFSNWTASRQWRDRISEPEEQLWNRRNNWYSYEIIDINYIPVFQPVTTLEYPRSTTPLLCDEGWTPSTNANLISSSKRTQGSNMPGNSSAEDISGIPLTVSCSLKETRTSELTLIRLRRRRVNIIEYTRLTCNIEEITTHQHYELDYCWIRLLETAMR